MTSSRLRLWPLVCAGLLLQPATAAAEWQFKPFAGVTFGGTYSFLQLDQVEKDKKFTLGGSATWLGNFIGIEGEYGYIPGYFETDSQDLVLGSSVSTLTGNVVLTLPRKMTRYTLRPYAVSGVGLVRVAYTEEFGVLTTSKSLGVFDVGGGVTGFVNDRIGLNWELRYFRSFGGDEGSGLSFGREQISFWRATMGVAVRVGRVE